MLQKQTEPSRVPSFLSSIQLAPKSALAVIAINKSNEKTGTTTNVRNMQILVIALYTTVTALVIILYIRDFYLSNCEFCRLCWTTRLKWPVSCDAES